MPVYDEFCATQFGVQPKPYQARVERGVDHQNYIGISHSPTKSPKYCKEGEDELEDDSYQIDK